MIHIIDLNFKNEPNGIAAFLVEAPEGPILVETGPHSSYNLLCDKIAALGFDPFQIKHVLLTHIHLDHAGAAWAFAENGASIYLHPFGYRHLHNPEKLLASAKMIYKDEMDRLWGTLKPIPEHQLITVEDNETLLLNGIKFTAHYTPGHAKHHIAWQLDNTVFTGDVAGISINNGPVVPPCPPPDINIEDWLASIEKLKQLDEVETYYLTHFGAVTDIHKHLDDLIESLTAYANFLKTYFEKRISLEKSIADFKLFNQRYLQQKGLDMSDAVAYENANPSDFTVAGLLRYWHKKLALN